MQFILFYLAKKLKCIVWNHFKEKRERRKEDENGPYLVFSLN
jgi:hypothetical protein